MDKLHFELKGSGTRKIILLHGFMGSTNDWDEAVKVLEDNYEILMIDLPGHGKSINLDRKSYSLPFCMEQIVKIVTINNFKNSTMFGYSMGGRIALSTILKYSDITTELILESSSPGLNSRKERMDKTISDLKLIKDIYKAMSFSEFEKFLNEWYSNPLFGKLKKHKSFGKLVELRVNNLAEELEKSLIGLGAGTQPSHWGDLSKINMPVTHIVGNKDKKYLEIAEQMAETIKDYSIIEIDKVAHNAHFEKGKAFWEMDIF